MKIPLGEGAEAPMRLGDTVIGDTALVISETTFVLRNRFILLFAIDHCSC